MEFAFPEETQMLRKEIRRFVDQEFRPAIEDIQSDIERYHELDPEYIDETDDVQPEPIKIPHDVRDRLREKARELGFWAMGVPEAYGGGGLNLVERCVVLEELSKHPMGLYQPGLSVIELGPGLVVGEPNSYLDTATDDQIERFFQPCIDGEAQSCFGLTEPAAGSDPRGMETNAERDGEEWVINGQKHWITYAGEADFIILFARTGPKGDLENHGITTFLVPTDLDGVSIPRSIPVIRPEYPWEIHLDDVRVPDANRLGDVGGGLEIAKRGLTESRILYAANSLGPMEQAVQMGIDRANERTVGGEPLRDRQAIQWKIAKSATDFQAAKYATYHAAWHYDAGNDARHWASMAKYQATETLWTVLDRMVQVHGALGVTAEIPLQRWLRESRVRRIGEGPSEVHLKTMARNLLDGYNDVDPL